jgi:hypothetical protein
MAGLAESYHLRPGRHSVGLGGPSRRDYLRETYFDERVPLMDWWANRVAGWLA